MNPWVCILYFELEISITLLCCSDCPSFGHWLQGLSDVLPACFLACMCKICRPPREEYRNIGKSLVGLYSREPWVTWEAEPAAKERKADQPCKGVLNTPLDKGTEARVASTLIWWGTLVCVRHWCQGDFPASGARQNSAIQSRLQPVTRLEASFAFLQLPGQPSACFLSMFLLFDTKML